MHILRSTSQIYFDIYPDYSMSVWWYMMCLFPRKWFSGNTNLDGQLNWTLWSVLLQTQESMPYRHSVWANVNKPWGMEQETVPFEVLYLNFFLGNWQGRVTKTSSACRESPSIRRKWKFSISSIKSFSQVSNSSIFMFSQLSLNTIVDNIKSSYMCDLLNSW